MVLLERALILLFAALVKSALSALRYRLGMLAPTVPDYQAKPVFNESFSPPNAVDTSSQIPPESDEYLGLSLIRNIRRSSTRGLFRSSGSALPFSLFPPELYLNSAIFLLCLEWLLSIDESCIGAESSI